MSQTMSRISPKGLNGILAAALLALTAATLTRDITTLPALFASLRGLLNPCTLALLSTGLALCVLAQAAISRARADRENRTADA